MTLEEYLLVCLAEEASEVAHATCKCLRFKPNEAWPGKNGTNLELLIREVNDLMAILEMLADEGCDLKRLNNRDDIISKKERVLMIKNKYDEAMLIGIGKQESMSDIQENYDKSLAKGITSSKDIKHG